MNQTSNNASDLAYADQLWKAADTLRGQIDAAEYKHVVLGPQLKDLLENSDGYSAERAFSVPPCRCIE